ncbi:uncharacterized protein LOC129766302 [Toxorhynchites rutilus septentrionalis]|uniref:uncharacterized protein LOC129766302 n=1 Tax=Toxorhynchites rutilus septentrionalis TaxID=329112 RepID=UPI0024792DFE|nr:uncharacterized protein LOC129766302 [Toxorhynchites rutilus septentrionalis]
MSNEMKDLKKQQRQVQNTFDAVQQFIRKFKPEKHQLQIQVRLEMLESAMKKFYAVRRKSTLQSLQSDLQTSSSSSSKIQPSDQSCVQSRVKLPEIRLPSFGGKTRDWVTFRDMFRSLIHRNEQLTEMDKFTYLRSSLTGEALQEVNSIEMSAVNYTVAWEVLETRYENKKLIVKAHLDALFAEEPMKRENYEALNHLLSEYDRNLQMLEKIGEAPSN